MKEVITLPSPEFKAACGRLEELVRCDGFRPDVVLGIENGGRHVAEQMFADTCHCYVAMRRRSTMKRGGIVRMILKHLPRAVCDMLRRVEDWRAARRPFESKRFEGCLPTELAGAESVLIVDDAADSGATLKAVCDSVRGAYPPAVLRSAVVVSTMEQPLVVPDYVLFRNCLIRFPWSDDMKK